MIFTHDPFERRLPAAGYYRLTDGVADVEIDTAQKAVRERYHSRFQSRLDRLRRLRDELGLFLIEVSTDEDPVSALKSGLGMGRR